MNQFSRSIFRGRSLAIILTVMAFAVIQGCTGSSSDEIPITTSSPEALKHYLSGRELSENLRNDEATRHFERAVKEDPELRRSEVGTEQPVTPQPGAASRIDRLAFTCVASGPATGRGHSCQAARVRVTQAVDLFSRWLAA